MDLQYSENSCRFLSLEKDQMIGTANPELGELDLLFIVGGIYDGEGMPELLEYVKSIDAKEIKRAALITSYGSKRQKQGSVCSILNDKVVGIGHPNGKDVEDAVSFASRILESNSRP
jgi:hypothetical protein